MTRLTLLEDLADAVGAPVTSDPALLADYAQDWWPLAIKRAASGEPLGRPDVVVTPTSAQQVADLVAFAGGRGVPLVAWGLGSSVVGSPLASRGGVVCDLSQLTGIVALSEEDLMVSVRAGMLGLELENELNQHGLTLGHSPQSLDRSTVGGWIATRATGQFSSRYGGIEGLLVAVEVALPAHGLVRTPLAPRPALGPDLAGLLVGSEGTYGIVTEATLRVHPLPEQRQLEAVRFDDVDSMVSAMREIMHRGLRPFVVRGYDHAETEHLSRGEVDGCVLLLGTEGVVAEVVQAEHTAALREADRQGGRRLGSDLVEAWLERRFDFSTIEETVARPGGYAETIEVGALWSGLVPLHTALTGAVAEHADTVLGHFSHVYPQGSSLYVICLGQADDDHAATARLEAIWEASMRTCIEEDAAIAHHHGVGLARRPWLSTALGDAFAPLHAIKHALDPAGVCNPGKLTDPASEQRGEGS